MRPFMQMALKENEVELNTISIGEVICLRKKQFTWIESSCIPGIC